MAPTTYHSVERATRVFNLTTMLQIYVCRIAVRNVFSPIIQAKKYFQQYTVDAYCRLEGNNIEYIKQNQATLCADKYTRPCSYSSFFFFRKSTFNESKLSRCNGNNCLIWKTRFLTFTCNPKWQEITVNL